MIENKIDIRKLFLYYVTVFFSDFNENGEFSFEKTLFRLMGMLNVLAFKQLSNRIFIQ